LFEKHDKQRFELTAISFGRHTTGAMRERLTQAFDRFIDVQNLTDRDVAKLITDLEIDIAVDLKGYTQDSRPGILAHRPAPVQVNYLGYPGTMGAEYIDYLLADRYLIPAEHQPYYTEKIVYLPDSYQVNDSKRAIAEDTPTRAEAGLPESGFVFCCFNHNYKITPFMFEIWMRLLANVPDSVLWLFEDNPFVANHLKKAAQLSNIAPERLVFAPRVKLDAHLARQKLADLFLDTLPYNAHTTTSDALWAGLPVVTCMGNAFAARVAGSLLHAIGLPELVTENLQDYEALALKLATNPALLAEIKAKLAKNRLTYPLFNADRFRRHIEAAYLMMWERSQRGEAPVSFAVPPIE
jgi:protein O-GlcNAc transferase